MADTLVTTVTAGLGYTYTNDDFELSDPVDKGSLTVALATVDGTGAGAADVMYHARFSIASAGTQAYDLAGSLTGAFGASLTFVDIKTLLIYNKGAGASYAAAAVTAGEILDIETSTTLAADMGCAGDVESGGLFLRHWPQTGVAVTATSADTITLTNNGAATVHGDIIFVGTTA